MAVVAGGLVAVAVVAAAFAGPWQPATRPDYRLDLGLDLPTRTPEPVATPDAPFDGAQQSGDTATWLKIAFFVAVLVALALLGAYLARAARRWMNANRPPDVDRSEPGDVLLGDIADLVRPALADGVDAATDALDRDVPPGDAVIAAWVALEDAAEGSGVVRDAAQTATEFTLDLLDATEADPDASRVLLDLYLAARFSEHEIRPDDVTRARGALAAIGAGVRRRRHDDERDEPADDEPADDERAHDEHAHDEPAHDEAGA